MPKRPPTIEEQISQRFLQIMSDYVGPTKKFRFKKSFSDKIGMRQQDIHKIEHGGAIQYRHLPKLQEVTGINLNWLITGKGEKYLAKSNGTMSIEERLSKIERIISRFGNVALPKKELPRKRKASR